uniref:Ras-GAP domain-containing protein n=1 Tax=Paramoeba aestuarina TaxID=180227 RepID=A0A7S4PAT3_9EUKA
MAQLMRQNNCFVPGLLSLVQLEINATLTGTTLFRENNICTYMLTLYTKTLAAQTGFLKKVIYPPVLEICNSNKNFDFSGRGKESPEQIQENLQNVLTYVEKIFENILASFDVMPIEFFWISHVLQTSVLKKFPECKHSVVGSFLFLRLLCPLVVTPPPDFEGLPNPIPPKAKKGLVLVSKILQNMSNGTFLRESNTDLVNDWLKKNKKKLEDFFDTLGSLSPDRPEAPSPPVGLSPSTVTTNFDDALHIHSFLHSHLVQVDEAIRNQLPCGNNDLKELASLLVKLPSGIEPFLEGSKEKTPPKKK